MAVVDRSGGEPVAFALEEACPAIVIGDCLQSHASQKPDQTALYCCDETISWRALDEASTNLARWFLDQGLAAGDRVAVHSTNSIALVQIFFALFRAGLVVVPVNVRLKPGEIRHILDHSGARLLFSEPELLPLAKEAGADCPIFSSLPSLDYQETQGLPVVDPDQPALIIYTSGTTARPKGVTHTHRGLLCMGVNGVGVFRHVDGPFWINPLPMMHIAALWITMMTTYRGTPMALLPKFDPGAVLDAIERFGCSVVGGLPTMLHMVMEEQALRPRQVSSLRAILGGGDAVSAAMQQRCQAMFGLPLLELYGMTEACPISCNPANAPRAGSMGVALGDAEIRVVDDEARDVPPGETGEVVVRGSHIFQSYWDDGDGTRAGLRDGWLHTGDLGSRDADGYLWFRGRKKEIIVRAGSNISPQEVEEALCPHPAILEVGVTGVPDPVTQERVAAFVVLRDGQAAAPDDLRAFAAQRLADYKLPEEFHFLDQLPKNPVGKVQRRALKELWEQSSAKA